MYYILLAWTNLIQTLHQAYQTPFHNGEPYNTNLFFLSWAILLWHATSFYMIVSNYVPNDIRKPSKVLALGWGPLLTSLLKELIFGLMGQES